MNIRMGRVRFGLSTTGLMQYFLLYLLLISHGAVIYTINSEMISNFILAICVVYVVLHRKMFSGSYVVHIMLFAFLMCALMILHAQPYFMKVTARIIESLLLVVVTYWIDEENFFGRFIHMTLFFAIVSLAFYTFQILEPNLLQHILIKQPEVTGWETSPFYGKWLYTYRGVYALYRNNGIFTEPGLYQMILNSALAILLFFPQVVMLKKSMYIRYIVVLVLTIITTSSTTGYIGLAIIIIGYLLKKNKLRYSNGIKKYIIIFLVALIIGILYDYYIRGNDSIMYINVISKFEDIGVVEDASGGARLSVIEICGGLFAQNPISVIFGNGYTMISSAMTMSGVKTAGAFIVYFLAAAGLPITIFLLYPYIFKPFKNVEYFIECIVFLMLYFNTSLAQSREIYPVLLLLPFALKNIKDIGKTENFERKSELR